jgi:hypothetical protein
MKEGAVVGWVVGLAAGTEKAMGVLEEPEDVAAVGRYQ